MTNSSPETEPFLLPGEIYPGIEPSRLARISRTIIKSEYVRAVYGEEIAERYDRVRKELANSQAPESDEAARPGPAQN